MKPTAIVFGCTGQDGSYLCKSLIDKDFEVIGTSRKNKPTLSRLIKLEIFKKIKLFQCDLENYFQTKSIIEEVNPLEIYHLSAQSSVGNSFKAPSETQRSIVNTTFNILEACREINYTGNIFIAGSSEIYGSTKAPAELKSDIDLRSPYATAKYQSFILTRMYREIYNLNCATGILFNHESPLRDERFVIKKIIKTAINIKKGNQIKLKLGNVNIRRDWGFAKEYVEAFQIINRSEINKDYIVCTGKSYSLNEVIGKIFSSLNLNSDNHVEISKDLIRQNEIDISVGDPKPLYQDLGWKSKKNIDELIKILIEDELFKEND